MRKDTKMVVITVLIPLKDAHTALVAAIGLLVYTKIVPVVKKDVYFQRILLKDRDHAFHDGIVPVIVIIQTLGNQIQGHIIGEKIVQVRTLVA